MDGKPQEIFGKGYMTTEKLMASGVPFNRINEWLSSGAIEKVDRGVYCLPGTKRDDLALICPTLCDPIDGSPPGSPVPGILQARTLEWVAISFSNA